MMTLVVTNFDIKISKFNLLFINVMSEADKENVSQYSHNNVNNFLNVKKNKSITSKK